MVIQYYLQVAGISTLYLRNIYNIKNREGWLGGGVQRVIPRRACPWETLEILCASGAQTFHTSFAMLATPLVVPHCHIDIFF